MKTDRILTFTQAKKAAWDASAHLHGQGKGWDELLLAASQPCFNVPYAGRRSLLTLYQALIGYRVYGIEFWKVVEIKLK